MSFKDLDFGSNVRASCSFLSLFQAVRSLQGTRGGRLDLNVQTNENSSGNPCGKTSLKFKYYFSEMV